MLTETNIARIAVIIYKQHYFNTASLELHLVWIEISTDKN